MACFFVVLSLWLCHYCCAYTFAPALSRCSNRPAIATARFAAADVPNFCSNCGSDKMELRIPPGDERVRACCKDCGAIVYTNPKPVVACVVRTETEKCLLGKRAIEPRLGYWGIAQGYLELDETTREGAVREAREETGVLLDPSELRLVALYNVPGSVQVVYEAIVDEAKIVIPQSTTESSEIGFFDINHLPELCFPTVQWAIDHCFRDVGNEDKHLVQQKTKSYDSETNVWSEADDTEFV